MDTKTRNETKVVVTGEIELRSVGWVELPPTYGLGIGWGNGCLGCIGHLSEKIGNKA